MLRASFALERRLRGEGKDVRWLVVGRKGESTLRFCPALVIDAPAVDAAVQLFGEALKAGLHG